MERFFGRLSGDRAFIEDDEFRHFKVKRIKVGEEIKLWAGEKFKPLLCRVEKIEKKRAVLKVLKGLTPQVPKVFIRLYQCVPVKVSTFDEIVQKCSEVGVSEIVPVISKRSFQKVSVVEEKLKRWQKIALESMKQCGRDIPLKVLNPIKLTEIEETGLKLFPFERASENILKSLENEKTDKVSILIGPEGGFAKEEAQSLQEKGWKPVFLGDFILRAETAAAVAAAVTYLSLSKDHT